MVSGRAGSVQDPGVPSIRLQAGTEPTLREAESTCLHGALSSKAGSSKLTFKTGKEGKSSTSKLFGNMGAKRPKHRVKMMVSRRQDSIRVMLSSRPK